MRRERGVMDQEQAGASSGSWLGTGGESTIRKWSKWAQGMFKVREGLAMTCPPCHAPTCGSCTAGSSLRTAKSGVAFAHRLLFRVWRSARAS